MPLVRNLTAARRALRRGGPAELARTLYRRLIRPVRLFSRLSKRDLVHGRRAFKVNGSIMRLPADMASTFVDGTYYEKNVLHWFTVLLSRLPDCVVFDIGANYGYYTLTAAAKARAVFAFEPVSSTFSVLKENVERNELDNVTLLQLALGESNGEATITLYSSSGNNSVVSRRLDHLEVLGTEQVEVAPLDALMQDGRVLGPHLIKIDTEGGELSVLRGARQLLAEANPIVLLEHDPNIAAAAGYSLTDLLDEFLRHSYDVFRLRDAALYPHDFSLYPAATGEDETGTLVAFPSLGPRTFEALKLEGAPLTTADGG
jgi:FkbM family methyltransferase